MISDTWPPLFVIASRRHSNPCAAPKKIISQLVTLRRGEELVRVSKRSGDIITLREVVEKVGIDACRFFFLSRSADSQMDFDLELAKKESADNPIYYIQYAHARVASILRPARQRGIDYRDGDVSLLTTEPELALIRRMLRLPEIVEIVAHTQEPHHLTYYAQNLAIIFHNTSNCYPNANADGCPDANRQ